MRTIRLTWPSGIKPNEPGEIFLDQDQARHGVLVLRLKPGDPLEMVGPLGLATARVNRVELSGRFPRKNPGLCVSLVGPWKSLELQAPRLALSLIQAQRFDWAVEKSVELGAAQLIPLMAERCKSADRQPGPARQERWRRLAEEARKQCGRPNPMLILPPQTLPELLTLDGPGFFLSPTAASSIRTIFASPAISPLLAVGPEGGFSHQEEKAMTDSGFQSIHMGSTVLRAETAALAVLANFLN